jgi:acyl carrier protein
MDQQGIIQDKIFEYVRKYSLADLNKLSTSTLLFREGIFDSMAFIMLIDFIEENFGIQPGEEDLIEENFESVEAITKYILRQKNIPILNN